MVSTEVHDTLYGKSLMHHIDSVTGKKIKNYKNVLMSCANE